MNKLLCFLADWWMKLSAGFWTFWLVFFYGVEEAERRTSKELREVRADYLAKKRDLEERREAMRELTERQAKRVWPQLPDDWQHARKENKNA